MSGCETTWILDCDMVQVEVLDVATARNELGGDHTKRLMQFGGMSLMLMVMVGLMEESRTRTRWANRVGGDDRRTPRLRENMDSISSAVTDQAC